jgi:hypothetical protein
MLSIMSSIILGILASDKADLAEPGEYLPLYSAVV